MKTYDSMMSVVSLATLDTESALGLLGRLIDLSFDLKRADGLRHAVSLSEQIRTRQLSPEQSGTLEYFLGNAWQDLRGITKIGTEQVWDWEQEETEKALIHYRRTLLDNCIKQLPARRVCEIFTNLANLLNEVGRFVEAIEYWNRALELDPSFPMARGNKGYGLICYARALYDKGQKALLLKYAHADLKMNLSEGISDDAKSMFDKLRQEIESALKPDFLNEDFDVYSFSLGGSEQETKYRRWCLQQRLFLNPLNDLGPYPIAAKDILTTPNIVAAVSEGPHYQALFNQLKQEFVSARYLYWEAIEAKEVHFSDRRVLLFDTLDYPAYCLAVEKMKAAYRVAYSLFDKIAFFLNHYLNLSIRDDRVKFRTFWYDLQERKRGLRSEFERYRNWPLRGVFWLSKDFYENKPGFKEAIEPDAQELSDIRNHLEHRYLKLHDDGWRGLRKDSPWLTDTLAYSMHRSEFRAKSLRLLKMARAALIYLSLSIHREEKRRAEQRDPDTIIPPMELTLQEDDWKL